jgi:hypothetical protein
MLLLTRQEFENAALTLGFQRCTLRQWKHRGKVPAEAKWRMTVFFDAPFEIIDEPEPTRPQGLTLAQQAARYIR